jgi:hypothetical protein
MLCPEEQPLVVVEPLDHWLSTMTWLTNSTKATKIVFDTCQKASHIAPFTSTLNAVSRRTTSCCCGAIGSLAVHHDLVDHSTKATKIVFDTCQKASHIAPFTSTLFCVQKNNSLLLCSHCIGCPP